MSDEIKVRGLVFKRIVQDPILDTYKDHRYPELYLYVEKVIYDGVVVQTNYRLCFNYVVESGWRTNPEACFNDLFKLRDFINLLEEHENNPSLRPSVHPEEGMG